jgi:hypothetical protein
MSKTRDVLRIVTLAWAAITLIHFTIWSLTSIIGGGLDYPWWLWFAVPPGIVLGALWWLLEER